MNKTKIFALSFLFALVAAPLAQAQSIGCTMREESTGDDEGYDSTTTPASAAAVTTGVTQRRFYCDDGSERAGDRVMVVNVGTAADATGIRTYRLFRDSGVIETMQSMPPVRGRETIATSQFMVLPRGGDFEVSADSDARVLHLRRGGGVTFDFSLAQDRLTAVSGGGSVTDAGRPARDIAIPRVDGVVIELGTSTGGFPAAAAARFNARDNQCYARAGRGPVRGSDGVNYPPRVAFNFGNAPARLAPPFIRDQNGRVCPVDYSDLFTWTPHVSCNVAPRAPEGTTCALVSGNCVASRLNEEGASVAGRSTHCVKEGNCQIQHRFSTDEQFRNWVAPLAMPDVATGRTNCCFMSSGGVCNTAAGLNLTALAERGTTGNAPLPAVTPTGSGGGGRARAPRAARGGSGAAPAAPATSATSPAAPAPMSGGASGASESLMSTDPSAH